MDRAPLPQAVQAAVARELQRRASPAWAVLHYPGKPSRYKRHDQLTVGDCEQLVEQHRRRAGAVLNRLRSRPTSASMMRSATEHVYRANLYAARYFELLGQGCTQADLPFPIPMNEETQPQ